MKKKVLALIMCIVMVIGILPVYAFAEDYSDWTYNVLSEEEKTAEITGYNGTETELVFPEEIDGYTMVAIANDAFEDDYPNTPNYTSITIPDTYTRIGYNNFDFDPFIDEVNLPHTLEFIGGNFLAKSRIHTRLKWDEAHRNGGFEVFYIGEYLIVADQNSNPPDCYTVKPGTKLIAANAFLACNDLKKIILPEGLEYINKCAFLGAYFHSIVIPSTVKRLEYGVFACCDNLEAFVIPSSVEYIDKDAFGYSDLQFVTIYGDAGSLAESFANEKGVTFVELKDVIYGDVDEDGTVTVADYASTKQCVAGENEFEGNAEIIGDMNSDCVIDAFDLFRINKAMNGIA